MHILYSIILVALLSACATRNDSKPTVSTWEGSNIHAVMEHLGLPNKVTTAANGNSLYIYSTPNNPMRPPAPPKNIIVLPGGHAISAGIPAVPQNTPFVLQCTQIFEVNHEKMVVGTRIEGAGC
jgi:hypothetical protein